MQVLGPWAASCFGVFFDEALGGLLGKKEGDVFTLGTLGVGGPELQVLRRQLPMGTGAYQYEALHVIGVVDGVVQGHGAAHGMPSENEGRGGP